MTSLFLVDDSVPISSPSLASVVVSVFSVDEAVVEVAASLVGLSVSDSVSPFDDEVASAPTLEDVVVSDSVLSDASSSDEAAVVDSVLSDVVSSSDDVVVVVVVDELLELESGMQSSVRHDEQAQQTNAVVNDGQLIIQRNEYANSTYCTLATRFHRPHPGTPASRTAFGCNPRTRKSNSRRGTRT